MDSDDPDYYNFDESQFLLPDGTIPPDPNTLNWDLTEDEERRL